MKAGRLAIVLAFLGLVTAVLSLGSSARHEVFCPGLAVAAPLPRPLSDAPWTPSVRVDDGPSGHQPAIAVDPSGSAYAVWTDSRASDPADIYFSHRPAGGDWTPNAKVNDDLGTAHPYQDYPSIAVDSFGNTYAVWRDMRDGNDDIYFSCRPAGGSWGANVKVNDDAGEAYQDRSAIAVDPSGNAHAVWIDLRNGWPSSDIYFSYRQAGGNWETNVRVNDDVDPAEQYDPSIAVDASGNGYAVWQDFRNGPVYPDIYFSYRPAGGSWGANVEVTDDTGTAAQGSPAIAVDATGNAYTVWYDERNGDRDIYFSYRPAGGSWGANVRVNDDAGTGTAGLWGLSIVADPSGNAYGVWADERSGDWHIYFSYRPAGGGPVLQLPFKQSEQSDRCRRSRNGLGCVSTYFDHEYPLVPPYFGGTEPTTPGIGDTIVIFSGQEDYTAGTFPGPSRYGYSGHDAYDFALIAGRRVLAAADGYATHKFDPCAGHGVEIDHRNGYATEYWHLAGDEYLLKTSRTVAAGERIGSVGQPAPNCGRGYHLHFVTFHNEDKDSKFERTEKVDPYGWSGSYQDPWPLYGGAESTCLWKFDCPTKAVISSATGGALGSSNNNILISAPAGAVTDTTWLQLTLTPDPVAEPGAVPAWHSFALSAQDLNRNPVVEFSEPLTIEVSYSDTDIAYLWEDTLCLYSWDDSTSAWLPISTILDAVNNQATANTTHLSQFTLMGQPQDCAPTVTSVSPTNGYRHLDTETTIVGTDFLPTPSVRLGLNELAVTFVNSTTLTAVVPSGLDSAAYDLTVANPDAQEATLESAFTVKDPVILYLPLSLKSY